MIAAAAGPAPDLRALPPEHWPDTLIDHYRTGLPGFLEAEILRVEVGCVEARVALRDELTPTTDAILHAGTVVAFADSVAGWGCLASLPDTADAFVTGELKANLVASARRPDALTGVGLLVHAGRATQVWDVTVARESDGLVLAHFRCTQQLVARR